MQKWGGNGPVLPQRGGSWWEVGLVLGAEGRAPPLLHSGLKLGASVGWEWG